MIDHSLQSKQVNKHHHRQSMAMKCFQMTENYSTQEGSSLGQVLAEKMFVLTLFPLGLKLDYLIATSLGNQEEQTLHVTFLFRLNYVLLQQLQKCCDSLNFVI